jgi:PPK2 family polyphosphate:nucleotide phosphotransferase
MEKLKVMKHLSDLSTLPPPDATKDHFKKELKKIREKLFSLQNKFYADGRFGLLIVLQGVDTAGKDGSIRHAFSIMNPMGIQVTSFKKPLGQELDHDFLWRVYPHFPAKRMIQVFNRSYYEDILVPEVNKTLSKSDIHHRCQLINELETHLIRSDIHILKFFLHISEDEQKQRIIERKDKPHKKWKYDISDDKAPREWKEYMQSYSKLLENCSVHPWHVIPSDKRWYRNYKVAEIVFNHLNSLKLKFPQS